MVKVTELTQQQQQQEQEQQQNTDSDDAYVTEVEDGGVYSDEVNSVVSDNEDDEDDVDDLDALAKETLWDRIVALQDAVPAHQRDQWIRTCRRWGANAWMTTKFLGNVAWVLTTSSMLVVVPLMFEMEKEQMDMAFMEFQHMQAQKAQVGGGMPPPPPSTIGMNPAMMVPPPSMAPPAALSS